MEKLKKKLCKYGKDAFKKNEEALIAEVLQPRFICRKCLRAAANEKLLCNPQELKK